MLGSSNTCTLSQHALGCHCCCRREVVRFLVELMFCAMFVVPVLGLMSQGSAQKLCAAMTPYGWRNFTIIVDVSIFRPLSGPVRGGA